MFQSERLRKLLSFSGTICTLDPTPYPHWEFSCDLPMYVTVYVTVCVTVYSVCDCVCDCVQYM